MKTLLHITIDDDGMLGTIEYNIENSDELYALSQALYATGKKNPEMLCGLIAMNNMIKDNPWLEKKFDDNVTSFPDFNKILKEK